MFLLPLPCSLKVQSGRVAAATSTKRDATATAGTHFNPHAARRDVSLAGIPLRCLTKDASGVDLGDRHVQLCGIKWFPLHPHYFLGPMHACRRRHLVADEGRGEDVGTCARQARYKNVHFAIWWPSISGVEYELLAWLLKCHNDTTDRSDCPVASAVTTSLTATIKMAHCTLCTPSCCFWPLQSDSFYPQDVTPQ